MKDDQIPRLARHIVTLAIRMGVIKRKPCEVCGEKYAVAHHDDYMKPLDVRFLCHSHHQKYHKNTGMKEYKMYEIDKDPVKCKKCGYKWIPRVQKPKKCPNCQQRNWEKKK